MSTEPTTDPTGEWSDEADRLRERVAALEDELADRAARANDALAAAQDRTYWLDRLHIDLNALMQRPVAARLMRLLPAARTAYRSVLKARHALHLARIERKLDSGRDQAVSHDLDRRSFHRAVEPSELRSAEITDMLLARVDAEDVEQVESRLDSSERGLLETAGELERRRFLLSFGVHYEIPAFVQQTGLRPDSPPSDVHSMGRGPAAAGGSPYYADLVSDALRAAGAPLEGAQRILDFGCSSGRVVRVLAAAYPDIDWYGCDPIADAVVWARDHLPGIAFERSPEAPPLPYEDSSFDAIYAISIWSHFSPRAAQAWLREMRRLVRPGGHVVLTTHGHTSLAHDETTQMRGAEQLAEIERSLYDRGVWFKNEFGPQGDHGVANEDWGTAFMSPEWLLARTMPQWELVEFGPGRVEANQDLYVFRRR